MKVRTQLIPFALLLGALLTSPLRADQTSEQLDVLFDTLRSGDTTSAQAQSITGEIWQHWLQTDNQKAGKLMSEGIRLMNEFALGQAVTTFTSLIELQPDYAEAWNKRATVYYMMGKFDESTADVTKTLKLEPRHFGALSGQGLIYLQQDRKKSAISWFRRALDVNPFMDNIRRSVEALETELNGKVI